jgi:hypothetical protein
MQDYFDQVRRAADANLYYVALAAALAIPDMCSAMETPDGKTTSALYRAWCDKWLSPKYKTSHGDHLTGQDCYGLRCSMLHEGRFIPHQGGYSRVLFVEPGAGTFVAHNNVMDDALNIDVNIFVRDMVESATAWHGPAQQTREYKANYPRFMQRYPQGLPPYMVGLPVIA